MAASQLDHHKASFGNLSSALQSNIFALAAAPLRSCKTCAALASDPELVATWLMHKVTVKFPLLTAAACKLWDTCNCILSRRHNYTGWELHASFVMMVRGGQLDLMKRMVKRKAWAHWLWSETVPQDDHAYQAWVEARMRAAGSTRAA
jgi:hypothetical protein